MIQTIIFGFENKEYRVEAHVEEGFTGSLLINLHWKNGRVMQVQASKSASTVFDEKVDNLVTTIEKV
jgi:hypothetical protein